MTIPTLIFCLFLTSFAIASYASRSYRIEAVYTADVFAVLEVDVGKALGASGGTQFAYELFNNGTSFADELVGNLWVSRRDYEE